MSCGTLCDLLVLVVILVLAVPLASAASLIGSWHGNKFKSDSDESNKSDKPAK